MESPVAEQFYAHKGYKPMRLLSDKQLFQAGSLATTIGALNTLRICGASILLEALFFARQLTAMKTIHQAYLYMRQGIIPEIAGGIDEAG